MLCGMDNFLLKIYKPEHFCREFVEIKKSPEQLGMYMALVLGLKPLMDDWIPRDKLTEFKAACRKYKIYVREDAIYKYINKDDVPLNVLGRECLTTTSAYGFSLESNINGYVHLFLSKEKKLLKKGMWYPAIVKDRVIFQPRIDSLKYGYALGYPGCCIRFFRKFNNWEKYSYLYEAYKNTKTKPLFFCNPFLKHTAFSYLYHMPCSYDCQHTVKLVKKLRIEIKKREPDYVKLTDKYLKMPFLIFYERKFYCFKGGLKNNFLRYKEAYFLSPERAKDTYGQDFMQADLLTLRGRSIILYCRKKVLKIINIPLVSFAPEYPFLIQFT